MNTACPLIAGAGEPQHVQAVVQRCKRIAQFVRQHGQEFVLAAVREAQFPFRAHQLGNVLHDGARADQLAVLGAQGCGADAHPAFLPILGQVLHFRARHHHFAAQCALAGPVLGRHGVAVFVPAAPARGQFGTRRGHGMRRAAFHERIGQYPLAAGVADAHAHRQLIDNRPEPPFVGPERRIGLTPQHRKAQVRIDARLQLARGKGLDQIVVGARLHAFHAGLFAGARRQQDHRNRARALVTAQGLQQAQPVHARHHHVGNHQVGRFLARAPQRGCAVARKPQRILGRQQAV